MSLTVQEQDDVEIQIEIIWKTIFKYEKLVESLNGESLEIATKQLNEAYEELEEYKIIHPEYFI